jgi:S-methylmethionine-dependent homocysteine/selenocysteine methylase
MYKNVAPNSQGTNSVFTTKTSHLMFLKEIIGFCCENFTNHISSVWEKFRVS